ncbi:MAG: hypothetical protein QOF27_2009 [Gaiellaceae bacterium]|nr:hypothetical protein [Gaiellaceae bacterium]
MRYRIALGALVALAALTFAASAFAHARISPPVALAKDSQVYTLAVPTEKENAKTTSIELTLPAGFSIDSFVPAAGWRRAVQSTGPGEAAVITTVTWTGGSVPTGEDAAFSFLALANASRTYTFSVRQTYSDGSVVDWSGPESSDAPAPTLKAVSSFGGGTSTLSIVALALAAVALVVAVVGLLSRGGRTLA